MKKLADLLGEELANQVTEKLKDDFVIVEKENYFPKSRWDEVNAEKKSLQEQLTQRDSQLEELKNGTKTVEELNSKIAELEKINADTKAKYESDLLHQKTMSAIDTALLTAGARNVKAVKALLEMDKISLDDKGEMKGFAEQLESIQKDNDYLFTTATPTQPLPTKAGVGKGSEPAVAAGEFDAFLKM